MDRFDIRIGWAYTRFLLDYLGADLLRAGN